MSSITVTTDSSTDATVDAKPSTPTTGPTTAPVKPTTSPEASLATEIQSFLKSVLPLSAAGASVAGYATVAKYLTDGENFIESSDFLTILEAVIHIKGGNKTTGKALLETI
jgi:hypothetical protein